MICILIIKLFGNFLVIFSFSSYTLLVIYISNKMLIINRLISIRRYLHQNPEIGFNTSNTISFLKEQIIRANVFSTPLDMVTIKGSLIVTIDSFNSSKPVLGFRSDIDALKIKELNNVSYRSTNSYMHACGHDAHTSILLNTIIYLLEHPKLIKNKLVFIFQAAEEGPGNGGAYYLVNHKIVRNIDYLFNVHINSTLDTSKIYLKDNILYSSGTTFRIKIFGKSSHVNNYNQGIDALKIALNVVSKINSIKTTYLSPIDKSIIMVNKFTSGTSTNIVSSSSIIEGTIRYFDSSSLSLIKNKIDDILKSETLNYEIKYNNGYPAIINNSKLFNFCNFILKHSKIKYEIIDEPFYLTDDFSRYNQNSKCFYYLLGSKTSRQTVLHSPDFELDETSMFTGFLFNLLIIKNINNLDLFSMKS